MKKCTPLSTLKGNNSCNTKDFRIKIENIYRWCLLLMSTVNLLLIDPWLMGEE